MLDVASVSSFARFRHIEFGDRNRSLCVADPADVSETAGKLARRIYRNETTVDAHCEVAACEAAGLLVYAIRYGCDFDELLDVADERVARVVSQASPDPRCDWPKRNRDLNANLRSGADASVLIVLLAETICVLNELERRDDSELACHVSEVRTWLAYRRELVPALKTLRESAAVSKRIVAVDETMKQQMKRVVELASKKPASAWTEHGSFCGAMAC
jgi:hypothetical protein